MEDLKYWIWLQLCLGQGAYFKDIIEGFGSVERLYKSNILEWKMSPAITAAQIEALRRYSLYDANNIIRQCDENNWRIIPLDSEEFPQPLRDIPNPPAVLYVDGSLVDFENNAVIAVVGTRKASSYATKAAHIMSKGMAMCGAVIVSGGAIGVDSSAHRGAMAAGSKTYAVLGNGFGADYLKTNETLREEIKSTGGALITEYPPFAKAHRSNFPMRNRLISGLSDGVLVVEAGIKSGSLITASHAAEQGKDIFAIPASIFDKNFQGSNKLIDDGAYVATSPETVLSVYSERYKLNMAKVKTPYELLTERKNSANAEKEKQVAFDSIMQDRAKQVNKQKAAVNLTDAENEVYSALSEDYQSIEDIIQKSNTVAQNALVALTMLEMKGLVESASGKRYRLK